MGTYGLKGVLQAWELEKLTTEQAIGQILQIIVGLEERLQQVEHRHNRSSRLTTLSSASTAPKDDGDMEQGL
jgi:hypothetical protein